MLFQRLGAYYYIVSVSDCVRGHFDLEEPLPEHGEGGEWPTAVGKGYIPIPVF